MLDRMSGRAMPRAFWVVLVLVVVGGLGWTASRQLASAPVQFPEGRYDYLDDASGPLFSAAAPNPGTAPRAGGATAAPPGSHPIRISLNAALRALETGRLAVVLPDNTRYDLRVERDQHEPNGDWTLVGRVATPHGDLASVLTFGPDGAFGTLPAPDGRTFHITTSHGNSRIALAGGMLPPGVRRDDPRANDVAIPSSVPRAAASRPRSGGPQGRPAPRAPLDVSATMPVAHAEAQADVMIDVLGVYTEDLVALRGSAAAAETEFANLIAVANQAHIDSQTVARFRLVGFERTDFPVQDSDDAALRAMTDDVLPDGLELHAARRAVEADLVAMLRTETGNDGTCGIAWLVGAYLDPTGAHPRHGYSVSNVAPCGPLVMAHEIGHNLGSTHDREADYPYPYGVDLQYGAYPFSFGYREGGTDGFATVMAYTQGEPWLGQFSNPVIGACAGGSCGAPDADNARSMNLMAGRIAGFGAPAGTISIQDAVEIERGDSFYSYFVHFPVRLSDPAPAGGVTFGIQLADGTATAGDDYLQADTAYTIPEGETDGHVFVNLLQDDLVEQEETFRVTLTDVVGAQAHDGEATATIIDDDPRILVQGRVVFPEGAEPPAEAFWMYFSGGDRQVYTEAPVLVEPPLFEFSARVVRGADVTASVEPPKPYPRLQVDLGVVTADLRRDIEVPAPVRISGRILFPEGQPVPDTGIQVTVLQNGQPGGSSVTVYYEALPPDFSYEAYVQPGQRNMVWVYNPPAPYVVFGAPLPSAAGDITFDVPLDVVPSVYLFPESNIEGDKTAGNVWPSAWLSAPAPPGGARFVVETVDATAKAGTDYAAWSEEIVIPEGQTLGTPASGIDFLPDTTPEADETFQLSIVEAVGANASSPPAEMKILNDDATRDVAGDATGDARADLVWHDVASDQFKTWMMDGARVSGAITSTARPGARVLAMGDFNGDRKSDLVLKDPSDGTLWLWRRDAGWGFDEVLIGTHPGGSRRVVGAGDFNGDGKADLLWENRDSARVEWWLMDDAVRVGTGAATLPDAHELLAIGDLDGDGRDDLVWRDRPMGDLRLWRGLAAGGFASPISMGGHPGGDWTLVDAVDVGGDGRADLLWHSAASEALSWWHMQGATRTGASRQAVPASFRIAATGDYTGDGRTDLVWRDMRQAGMWLWIAGDPSFEQAWFGLHPGQDERLVQPRLSDAATGMGGHGGALRVGDVDGNGTDDLLWHSRRWWQLDWWSMDGADRTRLGGQAIDRDFTPLAHGDFDGDGLVDVVWHAPSTDQLWLWRSRSAGQYVPEYMGHRQGAWEIVGAGDIDGDAKADLVWQNASTRQFSWWLMDGAQAVTTGARQGTASLRLLGIGDIDGDGHGDLVVHDKEDDWVSSWNGQASGALSAAVALGKHPGEHWTFAAVGDVDGDGHADLVWHSPVAGRVDWWLMRDSVRVGIDRQSLDPRYGVAATGDLDADGRLDLVLRDGARRELWLWRSTGEGFGLEWIRAHPRQAVGNPKAVPGRPSD